MAEPLIINASTAPTGMSMESPPVLGSTPSLGMVSRMTSSLAGVVSPLVGAPVVAAPVVPVASAAPVVLVPGVVSMVPVVAPVVVPVVPVVLVVVLVVALVVPGVVTVV